jgi:hypothetical protein
MMDSPPQNHIENQLKRAGSDFIYPSTPDIAAQVMLKVERTRPARERRRVRIAWAAGIVILVLITLMAVPPVRAQILEFLRFGAVRIFLSTPTPAPTQTIIPGTPTPAPTTTPTPLSSFLDLSGETSLAQSQQEASFPILLPTYPPDLGPPDKVFFQNAGGPTVILVWLQPGEPSQVRMSLVLLGPGSFAGKLLPEKVTDTTVAGEDALWLQGDHTLILRRGDDSTGNVELMVNANVLLWMEGDVTYRLETSLSLDEARRIAESLKPAPSP